MNLEEKELAARAREALGMEIAFAVARDPLPRESLSPAESARLDGFGLPGRREDWLRGRAALKRLLARLGLPADTSLLAFPHARLSLTHSAGVAVAAALPGSPAAAGIGVDYEARRAMKAGTERFFLAPPERERARAAALRDRDLLRLWTVKEALFKADPLNRSGGGRYLSGYVVEGPLEAAEGRARGPGPDALEFGFASWDAGDGFLSVALSRPPLRPA